MTGEDFAAAADALAARAAASLGVCVVLGIDAGTSTLAIGLLSAALAAGAARALQQARALSDTVVVDTSGHIAGVLAQTLKFHKLEDGRGRCNGIGVVEADEGAVRLAARSGLTPAALRLGSVAVDEQYRPRAVNLRALLGSA